MAKLSSENDGKAGNSGSGPQRSVTISETVAKSMDTGLMESLGVLDLDTRE